MTICYDHENTYYRIWTGISIFLGDAISKDYLPF